MPSPAPRADSSATPELPDIAALYDAHHDYIWRVLGRLGVRPANVEDAVQDVFLIAHRKADTFGGRSSVRTWIHGIAINVARRHRERTRRDAPDSLGERHDDRAASPDRVAERSEALRTLDRLLDALDDDKREVFVLAKVQDLSVPEIADVLGVNVNTVYSRLRAGRLQFEAAVKRHKARARRTSWKS